MTGQLHHDLGHDPFFQSFEHRLRPLCHATSNTFTPGSSRRTHHARARGRSLGVELTLKNMVKPIAHSRIKPQTAITRDVGPEHRSCDQADR